MNINIIISKATHEFKQKLQDFCQKHDTSQLTPELSQQFIQITKDALAIAGRTSIKEFIESFDSKASKIKKDGKVFRYKLTSERRYLTVFGELKINRRIYQADRGGKTYIPLDEYWNMRGEYATIDIKESLLFSSAQNTPEDTEQLLKKCALFNPSATTIKRMIKTEGEFFKEHREEIKEHIFIEERVPENTDVIVASMDGANVLLKENGKMKGKPVQRPQKAKSEKGTSCYKNAMVGSISFYQKVEDARPRRLLSRYESRMPQDKALDFKRDFEKEILNVTEKVSHNKVDRIFLCDGARGIWNYKGSNEIYKGFEELVDYYHTLEYLSKASEGMFGKSNTEGIQWYNKCRKKLLEEDGSAIAIIRSIKYYRDSYKFTKHQKELMKSALTFFKNNKKRMKYADFVRRGLPIGSGPVEAACKTIVKQRMCRSGMRWSRKGGENIIQFRTIVKSNRWDKFWNWYKEHKKVA